MEIFGRRVMCGKINESGLISGSNNKNTGHEFKNIPHHQQHNLIIYGAANPFKVEKLDQPQNDRATKCGKSYLPFPPSIKQNKTLGCTVNGPTCYLNFT